MSVRRVGVCVRANASVPPRAHAGVQTSMLELRLCNHACVFRPFLLTVESQQLPGGAGVCCCVNESVPHLRIRLRRARLSLETAEMNTCRPLARSRPVANRSLSGLPLAAADTRTFERMIPSH